MENNTKKRDWIEIIAKLLPGIGAVIAGIFIPLVININAERNRSNQLYAEIVSKREAADSELRARMFENLIKSFFGADSRQKTHEEKLTLLRLLALNFHESFDLKPLFEGLKRELTANEKARLKEIAREVVGRQEAMLSQVKEGAVFERTLYAGEKNGIMIPPDGQAAYKKHRLGIEVTEIGKDGDYAKLHVVDIPDRNENVGDTVEIDFRVSFCDMPFIANTKLFNNTRFAVTLKEIGTDERGKKVARIKIIFFPDTYMSGRDRPYLDEMLEQLKIKTKT
ncbi:MAG: hypothetical protein AB1442_02775 [Nitrospirota bacterium]